MVLHRPVEPARVFGNYDSHAAMERAVLEPSISYPRRWLSREGGCWYTRRGCFGCVVPAKAVCDAGLVGGCSSVGRAPRSQRGGQRFDPAQLSLDVPFASCHFHLSNLSRCRKLCFLSRCVVSRIRCWAHFREHYLSLPVPIKAAFAYYDPSFRLASSGFNDGTVSCIRRIGSDEHVEASGEMRMHSITDRGLRGADELSEVRGSCRFFVC
jgi:hypothetical protein